MQPLFPASDPVSVPKRRDTERDARTDAPDAATCRERVPNSGDRNARRLRSVPHIAGARLARRVATPMMKSPVECTLPLYCSKQSLDVRSGTLDDTRGSTNRGSTGV